MNIDTGKTSDIVIPEAPDAGQSHETRPFANTLFEWQYRDASNYKTSRTTVLKGELSEAERQEIHACLFEGTFFIPGQIGLADLQNSFQGCTSYWDPDADHIFHEINGLEPTDLPATDDMTAMDLLAAFRKAAQDGWDQEYTPSIKDEMTKNWEIHCAEQKAAGE